jgi:hypothetical protein
VPGRLLALEVSSGPVDRWVTIPEGIFKLGGKSLRGEGPFRVRSNFLEAGTGDALVLVGRVAEGPREANICIRQGGGVKFT